MSVPVDDGARDDCDCDYDYDCDCDYDCARGHASENVNENSPGHRAEIQIFQPNSQ